MSIARKLFGWLRRAAQKASDLFIRIVGRETAEAFADASLAVLKSALGAAATAIVGELQTTDMTSSQKRAEAIQRLKQKGLSLGLNVKDSLAALLIELAVAQLKRHIG